MNIIDLGLSVKWVDRNIGATTPEGCGSHLAWGEILPKNKYDWKTYRYGSDYHALTKYNTNNQCGIIDNKTILDPEDDVATINLGSQWHIPTNAEWQELIDNCTWAWIKNFNNSGKNGYIVKGINDNFIFLPVTGFYGYSNLYDVNKYGDYWSSSLDMNNSDNAGYVYFSSDNINSSNCYRLYGLSIRPVLIKD